MTVLQAYIDDSGEQELKRDPVFVLAGFIASAERWAAFSQEWQSALDASPAIAFFKMNQAAAFTGEFEDWDETDRDKKVDLLTGIIVKYAEAKVQCAIDKKAFAKYVRTLRVPIRTSVLDKPYAMAFQHIILATAGAFLSYGFNHTCDFIFDIQGKIGEDAVKMWDGLRPVIRANAARGRFDFEPFMGERPIFRDDKKFLPLQAADLYAWHVRRDYDDSKIIEMPLRPVMRVLRNMSTIQRYVDERELRNFREYIDVQGAAVVARNPNVKLIGYEGTRKQRAAARVLARQRAAAERKSKKKPSSEGPSS